MLVVALLVEYPRVHQTLNLLWFWLVYTGGLPVPTDRTSDYHATESTADFHCHPCGLPLTDLRTLRST